MLLALVFLMLVSLLVGAALTAINTYSNKLLPSFAHLLQFLNVLFDIAILSVLFAIIFKWLPKAPVKWKDVRVGSIITALLFTVGQFAITLYLGKMNAGSPYGDAGALIIILLWVYYSAQLLLLGAEFTNVWATRYGVNPTRSQSREPANQMARSPRVL
jgi:membrane protein